VGGRRKLSEAGKGSTWCVEDCCCWDGAAGNDWDGGEGRVAETTAESGGSDRGCDPEEPPAVGGRPELDPGRPSRVAAASGTLKLNVEV